MARHGGPDYDSISVIVSWDAATGDSIEFEVQRKIVRPIFPDGWHTYSFRPTQTNIIFSGLDPNKDYIYRVRARIKNSNTLMSGWSAEGKFHTPLPFVGHQGDHTVEYKLGTPAPLASPLNQYGYSPAIEFTRAWSTAVDAWNNFTSTEDSPDITICLQGQCGTKNQDGKTVLVDVIVGSGVSTFDDFANVPDCGGGVACVKSLEGDVTDYADGQGHMRNLEIIIEHPAWEQTRRDYPRRNQRRILWTTDPELHQDWVDEEGGFNPKWKYLPQTFMHELGHTLGLADLYRFGGYSDFLMGRFNLDKTTDSILSNDIEYLSDVYRNHSPHAP